LAGRPALLPQQGCLLQPNQAFCLLLRSWQRKPCGPFGSSWLAEVREQQTAFVFEVRGAVLGENLSKSTVYLAQLRKNGVLVDVGSGYGTLMGADEDKETVQGTAFCLPYSATRTHNLPYSSLPCFLFFLLQCCQIRNHCHWVNICPSNSCSK
jgi:hypothetical protein